MGTGKQNLVGGDKMCKLREVWKWQIASLSAGTGP